MRNRILSKDIRPFAFVFCLSTTILMLSCSGDSEDLPVVTTQPVSLHPTLVTSGCLVTSEGSSPVQTLGICWSTSPNPTIQNEHSESIPGITKSSLDTIKDFTPNTTYYVRAYATTSVGTSYGEQLEAVLYLNHPEPDITDIDGNTYETVRIGNQVWMKENLKTSRFRNGDAIPEITDNTLWTNQTSAAYCYYNNDMTNGSVYGKLYNIHAIEDARAIAPQGWRIPNATDWLALTKFLGSNCHGHMQESGSVHWKTLNLMSDNLSGFTALPSGQRTSFSDFAYLGHQATWWSKGGFQGLHQTIFTFGAFNKNDCDVVHGGGGRSGFAIRCIKE